MEIGRGAEAIVALEGKAVRKWRPPKKYRLAELDEQIRQERTVREARITSEARRCGVPTPIIRDVLKFELKMEHIQGHMLRDSITSELSEKAGEMVGLLHRCGIIHGDLTTSNMILKDGKIYLIDFGLASHDSSVEAQGVDVHVYFQTLQSTHDRPEELIEAFKVGYMRAYHKARVILCRVAEIKARGRYL